MSDTQLIILPDDEESIVGHAAWLPARAVVAEIGRFRIHAVYLEVEQGYVPTLSDLQRLLNNTANMENASAWAAADAALLADHYHGEDSAALRVEWSFDTLQNMKTTARRWPKELRVPGVKMSFHTVLNPYLRAALEASPVDEAEIERLITFLVDARDRNLTRDQFAADFLANRQPPSLRDSGNAESSLARSAMAAAIGKAAGTTRGMLARLESFDDGGSLGELIAEVEAHAIPFLEAMAAIQERLATIEGEYE